jgi:DNA-binding NarL/FixJ family response regulator
VHGGSPFHAEGVIPAHRQSEAAARAALGEARFGTEFRAGSELTLGQAIAFAQSDGHALPPQRAPAPAARGHEAAQLTRRELEIARLVAEGLTNKQIASQLVISRRTAEGHVEHILSKLGFTTRTQIASWLHARTDPD